VEPGLDAPRNEVLATLQGPTIDVLAMRLNILKTREGAWTRSGYSFFETALAEMRGLPQRASALIQARELLRQHYVVHKIEGPDEVIDSEAIEEWVKANPE